jgi:hypothetical protein
MHFYAAAVLLRQNGGDGYVVLHLKCQGIELVLKGWLLLRNFDKYKSKIRAYSHNLERLVREMLWSSLSATPCQRRLLLNSKN